MEARGSVISIFSLSKFIRGFQGSKVSFKESFKRRSVNLCCNLV